MSKSKKNSNNQKAYSKHKRRIERKSIPITVTVVTVTYNHKDYIRQCLDSLVCQKTNFRYQILVGDDCSTDGTTDIVRDYAKRYPKLIVPIIRPKNIGSIRNFGGICDSVTSKYIAFCDGDDYWTDENRLQKQVDYLEAHPEMNGCYCRMRIQVDDEWELENYYKADKKTGQLIWPDCKPGYKVSKAPVTVKEMARELNTQAVNTMLRVNHEIHPLPSWFYQSYIGDAPYIFLQMGRGKMGFMPDVMCVYRRSNSGIFYSENKEVHFLKTRLEYIKYFSGLRDFFKENFGSFGIVDFENRIKLEAYNYLNVLVKQDRTEEIADFFRNFPEAGKISLNAYLTFYNDSRKMTRIYGWEGNKTVARNSRFMHLFKPIVKTYTKLSLKRKKSKEFWANKKRALKKNLLVRKTINLLRLIMFWVNCLVPKSKKRWAIASFHADKYMDNSMYFYEYLTKNHPEIKATWFTKNRKVYKDLKNRGWRVSMNNTLAGAWRMARCAIAVTDHYKITDFDPLHGLSNRTKIVQLWHGVGLKAMGDGVNTKTTPEGVIYSYDILPQPGDSAMTRFIKKFKYFRHAFFRELFEKYFLFVCPGQERIDMIGKMWNIPEENYIMAGHPRNLPVYETMSKTKNNVIYAPTFRYNIPNEHALVVQCIDNFPLIQETMEKYDSNFVLRLHPHTWRNYSNMIKDAVKKYDRITYNTVPDIYPSINDYSVIISDYSSIAYDFMMFGKPAVFFCYDYDTFSDSKAESGSRAEPGFNIDYMSYTPGPKTYTWEETMEEVEKYLEDPSKDAEWRKEVLKYFFDENANGPDDSERITQEIKRRLKIK